MTVFADNLNNRPASVLQRRSDRRSVAQRDLPEGHQGDDKADSRITLIGGIDSADTHHTANSFTFDQAGLSISRKAPFTSRKSNRYGPVDAALQSGVFRYEPRAEVDVYVSYVSPIARHVFDKWGQKSWSMAPANPYDGRCSPGI